jgi:hypothetical protein
MPISSKPVPLAPVSNLADYHDNSPISESGCGIQIAPTLIFSHTGSQGKSVLTSLMFAAMGGDILSVHSRGDGTSAYMVPSSKFDADEIPQLFTAIKLAGSNVFVDVSSLCADRFAKYVYTNRLLPNTFGTIVIPVTPDAEYAGISTMEWLRKCDVDPARARLVLNRADRLKPIEPQFSAISRFLETNREFENVSLDCVLPESDIFNRAYHRYPVGPLLWNVTDYKAQRISARDRGATEHELAQLSTLEVEQRIAQKLKPHIEQLIRSLKLTLRP